MAILPIDPILISLLLLLTSCTTIQKQPQYTDRQPQKHALVVNYDEDRFKQQAQKAERELRTSGYNVTRAEASRIEITDKLEVLGQNVGVNDTFLFVWLGHGTENKRYITIPRSSFGQIYAGTTGVSLPTNILGGQISAENIADIVKENICAENKVYVIDACFSGKIDNIGTTTVTSSNGLSYSGDEGIAVHFCEGINFGDFNRDGIVTTDEAFIYAKSRHRFQQTPELKGDGEVRLR